MKHQKKLYYIFMIVLQGILYGIHDPLAKIVYHEIPVYAFLCIRYLLGGICFLCIFRKSLFEDLKNSALKDLIVSAVCLSLAYLFVNLALGKTDATLVVFVRSLSALFTPMLSLFLLRKKPCKKDYALGILLLIGLWFLFYSNGSYKINAGILLALAGTLLVAGSLVFGAKALDHTTPAALSFVQTILSAVICGICALYYGEFQFSVIADLTKPFYFIVLLYAALAVGCLGFLLQNTALAHLSSPLVGVLQCTYPLTTVVVAPFLLGEILEPSRLFGAFLVLLCILLNAKYS